MELSKTKLEIYEKNLQCLQEAADELMRRMKGYDYSFRREITDKKGEFCPEKLHGLVKEMLTLWEEKLCAEPFIKKGWVKSYLRTRRELYGLYLYLVMRCSLYRNGYFCAQGSERKERTDFSFLLEQAKWFSRSWCITDGPDGNRRNEPRNGYDSHFGFHFYSPINHYLTFQELDVRNLDDDWAMTPPYQRAENRLYSRTGRWEETDEPEEEGGPEEAGQPQEPDEPEKAEQPEADESEKAEEPQETEQPEEEDGPDMDGEEFYNDGNDDDVYDLYDLEEDEFLSPLDMMDEEDRAAWWEAEYEYQGKLEERNWELLQILLKFEGMDEYCSACRRFEELFKGAETDILRDFCQELEEIVNLYLSQRQIAPLADTEKAVDVYGRVCEGPLRQARIYGRGLQWKDL